MQCGRVVEKCVQIFIKKRLKMYGVYFTAILKTPQKNQKQQNKYFIKFLRPSEIILLSDALKGIPLSSKVVQCAAVRTIHSLMIDPPQTCVQLAVCPLKQNEYSYLKIPGFCCIAIFFLGYFILRHYGILNPGYSVTSLLILVYSKIKGTPILKLAMVKKFVKEFQKKKEFQTAILRTMITIFLT